MERLDDEMTLFYNRRTGELIAYVTGESDMGYFGDNEPDYIKIYDYLIVELDEHVMNNFADFKVVDGKIKYIQPDIPEKYL